MFSKSIDFNENYAARIVRVDEIHEIPEAHSIVKAVLGNDTVIVSKDTKVGDIVVFFPVGCCISEKYLHTHNLYDRSNAELNSNYLSFKALQIQHSELCAQENKSQDVLSTIVELEARMKYMTGFFGKNGNVRCLKLRGEVSMGYVAPAESLEIVWPSLKNLIWSQLLGKPVNVVCGDPLCWKYIPNKRSKQEETVSYAMPWYKKTMRKLKKFDRLIPGFCKPHYDTAHLERNAHLIDPEMVVTETVKVHGTSIWVANLPVRKKLHWYKKILKALGFKIADRENGLIYSTRRVIQNKWINPFASRAKNEPDNEYKAVFEEIKEFLTPGMTVYGEIVGYKPTGKCIQSPKGVDHDYGCKPGEHKFMPYRITFTSENDASNVVEWSILDVIEWTRQTREKMENKNILMDLELLYRGKAGDQYRLYEQIKNSTPEEEWSVALTDFISSSEYFGWLPKRLESHEEFIKDKWRTAWCEALHNDKSMYMELPEPLCKNKKAPREGIVIRIEGDDLARAWKCKTKAHAMLAQKAQDAGEADPEDLA